MNQGGQLFSPKKTLSIMGMAALFSLSMPAQLFATQYSEQTRLTVSANNQTVKEILYMIEDQSDFRFIYESGKVDLDKRVTVNFKNQTVESILDNLFSNAGIRYEITENNFILINPTSKNAKATITKAVAQQQKRITGKVVDKNGEPVIGANVVVKGTTNGTITDFDGNFSLEIPANAQLSISYIGYVAQEVSVNNRTQLSITLGEDSQALDEVVVVGYGTMKKRDLSGAVGAVKGSDLTVSKTLQLSTALQGAVAGLTVSPSTGPGATADVKVRGITTIGDSSPLVIVDGVPGDLNQVNPNDVENLTVLKDAASASIYGSRAASGVILITTKRAKESDLSLNYTFEYGWSKPTTLFKYVDAPHFIQMQNEVRYNDNPKGGWYQAFTEDQQNNWMTYNQTDPDHYPNTNWDDYLNSNAPRQSHLISIAGGGKKVSTKVSFSYDKEDGLDRYRTYERFMIRANNDIKINQFISASLDVAFRRVKKESPNAGSFDGRNTRPVNAAIWSDGRYASGDVLGNPLALIEQGGTNSAWYNRIQGKASIDITPFDGLKLSAVIAPTYNFDKTKRFVNKVPYTYYDDPNTIVGYYPWGWETSKLTESRNDDYNYTVQFIGNYQKSFGKHEISAMAGYENYYSFGEALSASRDQYELTNYPYLNIGPLTYRDNSGSANEYAYRSIFGRLVYSYANKYLLQVNFRHDGSSRFKSQYRWGNFPSVSAGWVVSEESFFKNLNMNWLSFLKLRGSWGRLGNERIGNYPTTGLITISNTLFYQNGSAASTSTAAQTTYVIPSLSWETTDSYDIGLDATFLDSRLRLAADYYKKKTSGMLLSLEIPDYVGYDNPSQNAGKMHTKGWEVELGWHDQIGDWQYGASVNLSDFVSRMGDLGGTEFLGDQVKKEGSEFNEWYGYLSDGLFLTQEDLDNSPKIADNVKVGDVKFKDISGPDGVPDGKISPEYDRVLLGGSLPRYTFGANLNVAYKGLDLSIQLQGVGKRNVRLNGNNNGMDYRWNNNFAEILVGNYWSEKNSDEQNAKAIYPRLNEANYSVSQGVMSSFWLRNGGYMRVKNITLGYTLPREWTQKIFMKQVRAYLSMNNLLTFDKLPKGVDPELLANISYPYTKSVLMGVSVNF